MAAPLAPEIDLSPALGAVTAEDEALDRELERMARENPLENVDDNGVAHTLVKEALACEMLRDVVVDYKPASTLIELESQLFQAKGLGIEGLEVTPQVFAHFCGPNTGKNPNWASKFFHYKEVKAYLAGSAEEAKTLSSKTMEEIHFGKK